MNSRMEMGDVLMNELYDLASMLEFQAKNALDNGRLNVEIDARVLVPQIVQLLRKTPQPEATPIIPEGWALVPIEPTKEMISDGCDHISDGSPRGAYKAMLWAAPKPTPPAVTRASIIQECRTACLDVGQQAHEAAKSKDATDYVAGYQDCAVDCDDALRELLQPTPQKGSS